MQKVPGLLNAGRPNGDHYVAEWGWWCVTVRIAASFLEMGGNEWYGSKKCNVQQDQPIGWTHWSYWTKSTWIVIFLLVLISENACVLPYCRALIGSFLVMHMSAPSMELWLQSLGVYIHTEVPYYSTWRWRWVADAFVAISRIDLASKGRWYPIVEMFCCNIPN